MQQELISHYGRGKQYCFSHKKNFEEADFHQEKTEFEFPGFKQLVFKKGSNITAVLINKQPLLSQHQNRTWIKLAQRNDCDDDDDDDDDELFLWYG